MTYEPLEDQQWRLANLYRIIDKNGDSIPFHPNDVQKTVFQSLHTRNLILKARQLGMSTAAVLYLLDSAIYNPNLSCGIVSYSLEHAQHIFKKIIGHAVDTLHPSVRNKFVIEQRSARELVFAHGSSIRVDTSLRGGSYQLVLVSEYGKTCARNPAKAEEVLTGTLQAVSPTGTVIIESTGEGSEGFFAEMVQTAQLMQQSGEHLSALDYKLFFFPWFCDPTYRMKQKIEIDTTLTDYFAAVEVENNITLDTDQRTWYAVQNRSLGDRIQQEYPSTIKEAFRSHGDAFYFAYALDKAKDDGLMVHTSIYDPLLPVHVAMDIGINDLTVMVFFQCAHGEIRVIDFYADRNKDVPFYAKFLLQDKKYLYNTIFLPHDSTKRDPLDVTNTYERDFRRLFAGSSARFYVLPKADKAMSISRAKVAIGRCVFAVNKVKPYVDMLARYRKKWSEQYGRYLDEPYHDEASNYGDSFIYLAQAVAHLETACNMQGALAKHKQVVEARYKRVI